MKRTDTISLYLESRSHDFSKGMMYIEKVFHEDLHVYIMLEAPMEPKYADVGIFRIHGTTVKVDTSRGCRRISYDSLGNRVSDFLFEKGELYILDGKDELERCVEADMKEMMSDISAMAGKGGTDGTEN